MSTKIYSYEYIKKIQVALFTQSRKVNSPMFNGNVKLHRNLSNKLDVSIRNMDKKPVKTFSRNLRIFIINYENDEMMLSKLAEVVDEPKGEYRFVFSPGDIERWDAGLYRYSMILEDEDGDEYPLYVDSEQNAVGILELIDRAVPNAQPSILISKDDFTIKSSTTDTFIAERYKGNAQGNFQKALHTISIKTDNFTGKFWVQASLEDNPVSDSEWFDVHIGNVTPYIDFNGDTGTSAYNFKGSFVWIRFVYQTDSSNDGEISKVWYKR